MDSPTPQSSGGPMLGQLGIKLYRFRNLVRRNWWVLAVTITLGLAYQGWQLYKTPRLFQSESQVYIREALAGVADATQYNVPPESFTATTLAMMKSSQMLADADAKMALEWPNLRGERPDIVPSILPRSFIFVVTGRGRDPVYTQHYVDAVVDAFIDFRISERVHNQTSYGQGLEHRITDLEKQREEHRAKLTEFVKVNNMPFWTAQATESASYLNGLKIRQAALQTELQKLRMMTPDQLLNSPPSQQPTTGKGGAADSAPMGNGALYNAYLTRMQELAQAQSQYQERSQVWKPKHPRLQQLHDRVAEIERSIEVLKRQLGDLSAQRIDSINAELKSLELSIAEWDKKILQANEKDGEYNSLKDRVAQIEEEIRKTREVLQSNISNNEKNDIFKPYQRALPATEVPNGMVKRLMIGLIGGLLVGIGILVFLDRVDDRMTSSSEMMEQFSEPILGQIPDVMASRGAAGLPLLQPEDDRYTFAEAFRSLRSSLIFMPNQNELRTLLVTSAIPNEGKSTIASNLAITMAAAGASVVLVDADLRRGDLASLFDTDGRTGLSNILRGEVAWKAAAQTTKYPTLTLIPRGPVTSQSSELLLLPTVDKLLEELRANFDVVVFNTAPILATDDTPTLSPHFDGSLMVIRAQFTSARLTQNALNALYQRQVNVLGLILNCVDTEMPDYYYYRYPKYYAAK